MCWASRMDKIVSPRLVPGLWGGLGWTFTLRSLLLIGMNLRWTGRAWTCSGLDYTGLDRTCTGLHWTGLALDWTGLALDWTGLALDWTCTGLTGLIGLHWTGLDLHWT